MPPFPTLKQYCLHTYSTGISAEEIENLFNQQVQVFYSKKFTVFRSSPGIIPGYFKRKIV
jgi:hypothetical protein